MALRFAKQINSTLNSYQIPNTVVSGGAIDYFVLDNRFNLMLAPSRYSEVRKVTFHAAVTNFHATSDIDVRLKIAIGTLGGDRTAPNVVTVPVQSYFSASGGGSILGSAGLTTGDIFDRDGDGATLASDASRGGRDQIGASQVLKIEFDLFDPQDQDFFTAWLAAAAGGDDDYVELRCLLEITESPTPAEDVRMNTFGCTIVQAPSGNNRTCTYLPAEGGRANSGSGRQDFDSALAYPVAAPGEVKRAGMFRFRYDADEWDGITSAHLHIMTGSKGNNGNLLFRLVEITANSAPATTTLFTETVPVTSSQHGFYRTQDLLPFLEDGKDYAFDWRHSLGSAQAGGNSGEQMPQWEIIQKGCSKTNSYFEARPQPSTFVFGDVPSASNDGLPDPWELATFFDPLWFEDYPDEFLFKKKVFANLNLQTASTARIRLYGNPNRLEDDNASLNALTPTTHEINPHFADNDTGWQYLEQDTESGDPIDLAGSRKIHQFADFGSWNNPAGRITPGDMGLKYNYFVPETEVPELGPLFELGVFDPEGCAATSAGLGDHPGLLVITNGSRTPKHFNPAVPIVEDNGVPTPFCEEVPQATVGDTGASPFNGLDLGTYTYRYTFRNCCTLKESDPNPIDIVVDTTAASPAAEVTLSFAGVRIPGDPQICEICIYRTVEGGDFPVMAKVGCFDPNETELFVDDVADAALDFVNDGLSLLNAPMPCVPIVAEFRNRLFGMGDIPNLSPAGTVSVVNGSSVVTGDEEVEWDRCLEGKFIQVEGDCRTYEIERVCPPTSGTSPPIGQLRLTDEYEGEDGTGLNYTICGRANRLYISEPLEPECWPAANFLDIEPGDGDRLMGAVSNFNRLVICKRSKTYVLTFREQPATEVVVPTRISSDIGCIGPRTFAQIESGSVWLSDRGLALYDGRSVQHIPESDQMNNMFIDPDNPRYVRRDANGRVIGAVGVFYPKAEQYLLLVPTVQTVRGANVMVVWDVKLKNITILEFCQEFMSMVVAKDTSGNERVYLGDTNGFVWIYDVGDNDGVGFPNQVGTVTGTITSAGVEAATGASILVDDTASFITGGLPELAGLSGIAGLSGAVFEGDLGMAGVCLFTRARGAGLDEPWTVRNVYAATPTKLYVTPPWGDDTPEAGYDYMLGPIRFEAVFKPKNYGTDDFQKRDWRHVISHLPEEVASQLRVELLPDFANSDPEELTILGASDPPETGAGRVFDLSFPRGRQVQPVGRLIHNYQAVRFKNFAPEQPVRILNHSLMVLPKTSK